MDYEEALKLLNEHTQYYVPPSDLPALDMAFEAMEKQIPKKVVCKREKYARWYTAEYFCPSCGESAETDCGDPFENYGLDWCNHCGQKLDWE